jgi:hypothetical protein
MSVVFHTVVGASIAHVAATTLRRHADREIDRPGVRLMIVVGLLALLSHGVLDGLKHGYPLTPLVDVGASLVLATSWCLLVRRPLRLMFAVALAGSFAPDVIDHTLPILRYQAHLPVPLNPLGPLFPWHWGEGSGSMYSGAPHKCHDLDARRNGAVSLANHVLVVGLACGGILTAPGALQWRRSTVG